MNRETQPMTKLDTERIGTCEARNCESLARWYVQGDSDLWLALCRHHTTNIGGNPDRRRPKPGDWGI